MWLSLHGSSVGSGQQSHGNRRATGAGGGAGGLEPEGRRLAHAARTCSEELSRNRGRRETGGDNNSALLRPTAGMDWNGSDKAGVPAARLCQEVVSRSPKTSG